MNVNIYIPVEVKIRELESKVLLALVAAEKGFNVIIGSKTEVLNPVVDGRSSPGIVHMKSVTPSEPMLGMLQQLRENGCIVTALDEEGGIIDDDFTTFGRLRFSEESLSKIDAMFCWGPFDQKSLQDMFPHMFGKFIATGSPRVDLWKKEFHEFHVSKESGLTDEYGKYVLLSSNFGTILNENRIPNMIARMREAGYFDRDSTKEEHEYLNAAYQTQLIWEFVKLFRQLSLEFPDINFIIRPHPVESLDSWKMLLGEYSNIHVVRKGSITPWVLNSLCVLHNGCTTGLEAAFFGKHVIAFRPLPSPIERVIPNSVSFQAFNSEDVVSRLKYLLGNNDETAFSETQVTSILKTRFGNYGDVYAFDGIVDHWVDLANRNEFDSSKYTQNIEGQSNPQTNPGRLLRVLLSKVKSTFINREAAVNESPNELLNTAHKFISLSDEEVDLMVNAFKKATGRFETVKYNRIGDKSFRFYKMIEN